MLQPRAMLVTLLLCVTFVTTLPYNLEVIEPEVPIVFDAEFTNSLETLIIPNPDENSVAEKVKGNLRYTFGKRRKYDRLVSHNTDSSFWPSLQNVTLILQYPGSGTGAVLTFIEVIVNQSSNIGAARVIAGGIGKRYIASIVEANSTYWFNYSVNIYGI